MCARSQVWKFIFKSIPSPTYFGYVHVTEQIWIFWFLRTRTFGCLLITDSIWLTLFRGRALTLILHTVCYHQAETFCLIFWWNSSCLILGCEALWLHFFVVLTGFFKLYEIFTVFVRFSLYEFCDYVLSFYNIPLSRNNRISTLWLQFLWLLRFEMAALKS